MQQKVFDILLHKYLENKSEYKQVVYDDIYNYIRPINKNECMKIEYTSIDGYKYIFDTYKHNIIDVVSELFDFFDYCLSQNIDGLINPIVK